MTYNPSIPQGGDIISQSQQQILTNFTQLNTVFGVDHVAYSPPVANSGKHNQVSLPEQGGNPATAANEVALYCKDLSSSSTLYLRKESAGTVITMSGQDPIRATAGSTFLPGDSTRAVVMKWGTNAQSGTGTYAVSFASAFSTAAFTCVISIRGSALDNEVAIVSGSLNVSGFSYSIQADSAYTLDYIAIGN